MRINVPEARARPGWEYDRKTTPGKRDAVGCMKVLDCENADSTYASLEEILGVTRSQLERVFENF